MKLRQYIKDIIEKNGPITFREFMNIALYQPGFGYYAKDYIPIGKKGDFVTSPHSNPIFGALVANQFMEMWQLLGESHFYILEMGSGAGYCARDILSYLKEKPIFDSLRYIIIERNSSYEKQQRQMLSVFEEKVEWVKDISEVSGVTGCFFSNELLDSFPVHVIQREGAFFKEVYVTVSREGELVEELGELSSPMLVEYCVELKDHLPEGYRTEINLEIERWINSVSSVLERGFVLTIDYGFTRLEYFHPSRNRGTLLCYRNHQVNENFFEYLGEQDITAHVNFSDLHRWGKNAGLSTIGYSYQGAFLAGQEVEVILKEVLGEEITPFSPALSGVKSLFFSQGMGDSHKVLVQEKGVGSTISLKGFRLKNMKEKLVRL